jgi:hypothetical protein
MSKICGRGNVFSFLATIYMQIGSHPGSADVRAIKPTVLISIESEPDQSIAAAAIS